MRLRIELDTGKAAEGPVTVVNNVSERGVVAPSPGSERALPTNVAPDSAPVDVGAKDRAWEAIREGRQKWLDGIKDEDLTKNDRRNYWIGGAIAVFCAFTGEDPAVVHNRLLREMPQPGHDNSSLPPGELPNPVISRPRAAPHPGAQHVVDEDDPVMEEAQSPIPEAPPEVMEAILSDDPDVEVGAIGAMLEGVKRASTDEPEVVVPSDEVELARHPDLAEQGITVTRIEDRS